MDRFTAATDLACRAAPIVPDQRPLHSSAMSYQDPGCPSVAAWKVPLPRLEFWKSGDVGAAVGVEVADADEAQVRSD
jgi:hypothetical protein